MEMCNNFVYWHKKWEHQLESFSYLFDIFIEIQFFFVSMVRLKKPLALQGNFGISILEQPEKLSCILSSFALLCSYLVCVLHSFLPKTFLPEVDVFAPVLSCTEMSI